MKMKIAGATWATLDLVMDLAANQRAMNTIIIGALGKDDAEVADLTKTLNDLTRTNTDLLRAKIFQYSEISLDDLLNGEFDI